MRYGWWKQMGETPFRPETSRFALRPVRRGWPLCSAVLLLPWLLGGSRRIPAQGAVPLHAAASVAITSPVPPLELVIGFMGGHVKAGNMVHKEAAIARDLQLHNLAHVKVAVFANHDCAAALETVLRALDTNGDKTLSDAEKQAARIAIYGHSWGASETINLARSLNARHIPVLLTIQVDSVQKYREDDANIPPNVQYAANFYQREGLLRGRNAIRAEDEKRTRVLVNEELRYRGAPVDTHEFPWFARTFMSAHIQIENDPRLWSRVEAMLQETIDGKPVTP